MQKQGHRRVRIPLLQNLHRLTFPLPVDQQLKDLERDLVTTYTSQHTNFYDELVEGLKFHPDLGKGTKRLKRMLLSQLVAYKLLQHTHQIDGRRVPDPRLFDNDRITLETFANQQFVFDDNRQIKLSGVWLIASLLRIPMHVLINTKNDDIVEQVIVEFHPSTKVKKIETFVAFEMFNFSAYSANARSKVMWASDENIANMNWSMIEEKLFDFRCWDLMQLPSV